MTLGMEVSLSPGDFVLDGDPALLPPKRDRVPSQFSANFYCAQTAGCITMPLGMEVGLSPGDFVFDGDPALSPIFGPSLLWPNGWMDQDGTWHGGGPWCKPHCTRWGPSSHPAKRGQSSPIFGPFLLPPNGWMHQDVTWYGGRPQPRRLCVRWGPSPLPQKGWNPQFWPTSIVAKRLYGSRCHLVRR